MTILEIDDKIISTEILTECFACDLSACKGDCCVEGNAGAPLDVEEVDILEEVFGMTLATAEVSCNGKIIATAEIKLSVRNVE